ncbi:MAG: lipocalin family protein [Thermodesulfobacteriota bacterium]
MHALTFYNLVVLILTPTLFVACASFRKPSVPPLEVVSYVDLKRYAGTWYEIARFPHRFQEGCLGSRATYTLLQDGSVEVLNQCYKGSLEGELSSVRGKAWVTDRKTNAKLKVRFFWPFTGDYWIIDLGENYDYAVVGHPTRKYLWILSRAPQIDEALYERILKRLRNQSYDVTKLMKTPQPQR